MGNISGTLGSRIKHILNEKGISQSQLARMIGVKQQTISYICAPESPASTSRYATKIAEALGVNPVWLQTGTGGQYNPVVHIEVEGVSINLHHIPILEKSDVAAYLDGSHKPNKRTIELMTDTEVGQKAFAVEVDGDSMSPVFKQGDRIVIDPSVQPEPGDYVMAAVGSGIAFRKYRSRSSNSFELVPLNDDWPTILSENGGDISLIGVMVEHRSYRRAKRQ